jgi:hypothetical protein
MTSIIDDLRYPIGRFTPVLPATPAHRASALDDLAALPARMRDAVAALDDRQLDTPYRPGGWTVRQVVHHVADSHLNAYIRLKLTLTEETPSIKPYDENAWAGLPDMRMPVAVSLALIESAHARALTICRVMSEQQFARSFFHPEHGKAISLDEFLQMYAWHSRHHVAHITALGRREGW